VAILATLGGLAALGVAHVGGSLLRGLFFAGRAWTGSPVDSRVLVVATVLTALATFGAGLVPALQASRLDLASALRQGVRAGVAYHTGTRRLLLVLQAALSFVLLVGAGLFVSSLRAVSRLPLGMDVDRLLVGMVTLPHDAYPAPRQIALLEAMRDRVRQLPGIEHVSLATTVPFSSVSALRVFAPGRDSLPRLATGGPYLTNVSGEYFATMGARIADGRPFTEADEQSSAARVVVNRTLAATYWPGERAVGQCLMIADRSNPCSTVIGVVEDIHRSGVFERPSAQIYRPLHSDSLTSRFHARALLMRSAGADPRRVAAAVQRAMQAVDPELPYANVTPLTEFIASDYRPWRLGASIFMVFGGLALVLAALGMFSVLSYSVAQRTHEMGVRVALGATRGNVLGLVLASGVQVTLLGIAFGAVAALALARLATPLLRGIGEADPRVFAGAVASLLLAAIAASLLPAWRATRVEPVLALRAD
jgi:predicted permease